MIKTKEIVSNKKKLSLIFFLVISLLIVFIETIGIGIIPIFLIIASNPEDLINKIPEFFQLESFLSFDKKNQILILFSSLCIFFLIKNLIIFFGLIYETKLFKELKIEISEKLLNHYLFKNYLFHTKNNPIVLARNVGSETNNVSTYIRSFLLLIRELLLVISILILLLIVDFKSTIFIFLFFTLIIALYLFSTKKIIFFKSKVAQFERAEKGKILYQIFCSIKDVIILDRQKVLVKKYLDSIEKEYSSLRVIEVITKFPRIIIEVIIILLFSIFVAGYLLSDKNFNDIIPLLSFYIIAAIRLFPTFNNISNMSNAVNSNKVSFDLVYNDLKEKSNERKDKKNDFSNEAEILFNKSIILSDINFKYRSGLPILEDISLEIEKNKFVAFIGKSGSGKSTTIDLIMGLIDPSSGSINIDGKNIIKNKRSWQNNIGYVPQEIYLLDDTILNNIAFGINKKSVNKEKINEVIKSVSLEKFIKELPDELNTVVGNNAIQLSGGQKQRIGLARALYNNPSVLILDEATSSLDSETEFEIINEINKLKGKVTVIFIAHRHSTIKNCDVIFELNEGRLINKGSFEEISKKINLKYNFLV